MLPEIRYSTAPSSSRLSIQIRTGMEDPCSSWTASHVLLTRKGQAQVKGPSRDTAVVSVSQTFQFIHEISFRGGNSTLRIPLQFTLELECQYAPYLTWKYPHRDNLIFQQAQHCGLSLPSGCSPFWAWCPLFVACYPLGMSANRLVNRVVPQGLPCRSLFWVILATVLGCNTMR